VNLRPPNYLPPASQLRKGFPHLPIFALIFIPVYLGTDTFGIMGV
jgi:hypothetical protein